MTTWSPVDTSNSTSWTGATTGKILLESGFPNFLSQEGGTPPINILLEGDAPIITAWTPVPT